jgi:hypothetical protein
VGHRFFFFASLATEVALAIAAAVASSPVWCAASTPAYAVLVWAYFVLRRTPYTRVLRPALVTVPLAVGVAAIVPGWAGTAVRWAALFVLAGWHHSALQALREWARFSVVIGPEQPEAPSGFRARRPR